MNKSSCCTASRPSLSIIKSNTVLPISNNELTSPIIPEGMIYIPSGQFVMGSDDPNGYPSDGEAPTRNVSVKPLYMDSGAVTNTKFGIFVRETGYLTEAEQYGWSFVFHDFLSAEIAQTVTIHPSETPWWSVVEGANWLNPEGPDSNIMNRQNHPVVHISWNDAVNYCNWAGKRLPTEAEWEHAARGGLVQKVYPWGNHLTDNNRYLCNIWQGTFPNKNTQLDGFIGTAPVEAYEPNKFGLYNMVGNVWEWCSDWFTNIHPTKPTLNSPKGLSSNTIKTIKGGSYLCHDSYCNRYRVAARSSNTPDSSTGNMGFRCVKDTN